MKFYELTITLYLKQELHFKECFYEQSRFVAEAMKYDDTLSAFHFEKGYKNYCFDLIYNPHVRQKEGCFVKNNSYTFHLRSFDEAFIDTLKTLFEKVQNPYFQFVTAAKRYTKQFFISELNSLTPVITTSGQDEKGKPFFWTMQRDGDILKLQRLLHDNLEKKYNTFFKEKLQSEQNFIQLLEVKNHKPQNIVITKGERKITFFGNKFRIVPHEDEVSQKLAFMAIGSGLSEKNSFGGGFLFGRNN